MCYSSTANLLLNRLLGASMYNLHYVLSVLSVWHTPSMRYVDCKTRTVLGSVPDPLPVRFVLGDQRDEQGLKSTQKWRHLTYLNQDSLLSTLSLFSFWQQKLISLMATVSAETFFFEGRLIMGHRNKHRSADVEDRRFRSTFGTTAVICAILWDMLSPNEKMPNGVKCCHLLWALMFMKLYASENVLCGMAKCDE